MDATFTAEEHFRRGEEALEAEHFDSALGHFRAAHRLDGMSPRYRSFYGLALGLAERRLDRALELCRSAAKEEFFCPEHYHNLARLHLAKPTEEVLSDLARIDVDPDHACYICSAIQHGDHAGVKVDAFGYRVHSIVTRTDAEIRPYLRIDGKPLVELDIANSQPLILAIALKSPDTWTTYIASGQHIGGGGAGSSPVEVLLPAIPVEELRGFTRLCENGELYEFLMAQGEFDDREEVKRLLFRDVLFGKPCVNGPMTKVFARHWPACLEFLRETKRAYGHKAVAQALQRLESAIIIDGVCGRLVREHPDTHFVTIHDSALAVPDSVAAVRRIMREEFERRGVRASVREKNVRMCLT